MRLLVTGAAGFLGQRLVRRLLARGHLVGRPIEHLLLLDQAPLPDDLRADARVEAHQGPLLAQCAALREADVDAVFHLASAVSAECEADFDLGLTSNLDSTRALLDALRAGRGRRDTPTRLVFSSSVAVFGDDPQLPLPDCVSDATLPTPQTSYGIQKFVCEQLVADYTRKGYIDGRSARLMTVAVRPGRPNGAASSFFSGIVREPLAGLEAVCPVAPTLRHVVASPACTVDGLIAVAEAADIGGRTALNLPGLNVSVGQMLDALAEVAGPEVRARVRFAPDARIQAIVGGWARGAESPRAAALGLRPDADFASVIRQYIADAVAAGGPATPALAGLDPARREAALRQATA